MLDRISPAATQLLNGPTRAETPVSPVSLNESDTLTLNSTGKRPKSAADFSIVSLKRGKYKSCPVTVDVYEWA